MTNLTVNLNYSEYFCAPVKILLSILLVFSSLISFACDGCNVVTGLVSADPVSFVSFQHRNAYFYGEEIPFFRHTGEGGELAETHLGYELMAKYFIKPKIHLTGVISTKEIKVEGADINRKISGFQDPYLTIGYQDFKVFETWQLNYNLFGGFDFGFGEYNTSVNYEYSPGSKSYDPLLGAEFNAKFKKFGIFNQNSFKIGLQNTDGYTFGNVFNSNLAVAYFHVRGNLTYVPFLGFYTQIDMNDTFKGAEVIYSSSEAFYINVGANIMFSSRLVLGGKYYSPLYKNFEGWKELRHDAYELSISYIFGK